MSIDTGDQFKGSCNVMQIVLVRSQVTESAIYLTTTSTPRYEYPTFISQLSRKNM